MVIQWDGESIQRSLDRMVKATKAMAAEVAKVGDAVQRMSTKWLDHLHKIANDEIRVTGLEGRYYVRGAMACHSDYEVNNLVLALLHAPETVAESDDRALMILLSKQSRTRLAASAIRGYVTHHPTRIRPQARWKKAS